jgi:hypothetical protein
MPIEGSDVHDQSGVIYPFAMLGWLVLYAKAVIGRAKLISTSYQLSDVGDICMSSCHQIRLSISKWFPSYVEDTQLSKQYK